MKIKFSPKKIIRNLDSLAASAIPRRVRNSIFYLVMGTRKKYEVLSGMFSGMKYVRDSTGSQLYPKILGTYELELTPVVKELNQKKIKRIINVGAAEGYYAIGLALTNPMSTVMAFEADNKGIQLIKQMAIENKVNDRIDVRGYCTPEELSNCLGDGKNCWVIMDVEGAEDKLIDLKKCPGLANAHLLVELHPFAVEGLAEKLTNRLKLSHRITEIWEQIRTIEDFPLKVSRFRKKIFKKLYLRSMKEGRTERMSWFYCEPV